jgi:hypothetical protein
LSGDDRYDRACAAIPNSECSALPKNYVMNVLNGAASKLAEQVASAKLVLPWLLSAIGAPSAYVGLLLPLRQAGTLLPQLAISGYIRSFPIRKWFWVGSALVQVVTIRGSDHPLTGRSPHPARRTGGPPYMLPRLHPAGNV